MLSKSIPALALLLCACTGSTLSPAIDWQAGARRAVVTHDVNPGELDLPACVAAAAGGTPQHGHWVQLEYRKVRQYVRSTALVPENLSLKPGDEVEFWPADCGKGTLPRIQRVLLAAQ